MSAAAALIALAVLATGCVSVDATKLARELRQDKASFKLTVKTRFDIAELTLHRYFCPAP